jgi:quaternary ammonium compound-resistance protein SugE
LKSAGRLDSSCHRLPDFGFCSSPALSGLFLWIAQKDIPIGTAYAVWTGIGAAGTFLIGIVCFKDPVGMMRILSFALIVIGVIGLKLSE